MATTTIWALTSCTCNTITMEMISRNSGNSSFSLLTFAIFIFMTVEGFIRHPEFIWNRRIPLRTYLPIILIFFITNVANNRVFTFESIPFPLIIIFRSGTLTANVILTWLLQNRQFSFGRICSVLAVTFGIILFTLAANEQKISNNSTSFASERTSLFFIGIFIMFLTTFASAYLGILQEKIFMLYGKHPEEMMFYVHLFSLPLFIFVHNEITNDFTELFIGQRNAQISMLFLFSSILFQYFCIRSVYELAAELNSLQVNLILSLRKFLNIFFSVIIFKNDFGLQHLFPTLLVLIGTFTFYDGHNKLWNWFKESKNADKEKKL